MSRDPVPVWVNRTHELLQPGLRTSSRPEPAEGPRLRMTSGGSTCSGRGTPASRTCCSAVLHTMGGRLPTRLRCRGQERDPWRDHDGAASPETHLVQVCPPPEAGLSPGAETRSGRLHQTTLRLVWRNHTAVVMETAQKIPGLNK